MFLSNPRLEEALDQPLADAVDIHGALADKMLDALDYL